MHRWLRVLICLLLVSCILLNLSPLKAEAVSATAVSLAVGIPVAVAVGLNALGVRQGSDSSVFNNVVSSAVDALSSEWAVNGFISMLGLTSDGLTKTFANRNFLRDLLDFLFFSETLTANQLLTDTQYAAYLSAIESASSSFNPCYVSILYDDSSGPDYMYMTSSPIYLDGNVWRPENGKSGALWRFTSSGVSRQIGGWSSTNDWGYSCLTYLASDIYNPILISTDQDLTLESVGHDIDTDYETYVETGIVGVDFGVQFEDDPNTDRNEEDDGNDLWLPVGIPGQLSGGSYIDQTQQDAQSGNTPQDVLDELLQNSGSGDGTGDSTGEGSGSNTSTWKPGEMSTFFLDLSNYFPFCIPFDLYDFLTCLNADPVAPVIDWELYLPGGSSIPIELDLSVFDPVAQILRRLELLVFCIGLAAKTRDLIKG